MNEEITTESNEKSKKRSEEQDNEVRLALQAQSDLESFGNLYEKYYDKVYKYFHFRLRNDLDAEDLTALTFEKAVTKIHTFQDKGYPFATWLFRIAHNCMVDLLREKAKYQITPIDELEPHQEPSTEKKPSFVDQIDTDASIEKMKEIIKTLPPLHQDIWGLKLASDISHKEIAETLGITENNVNVILHRSIKSIKDKFFQQ